MGITPIYSDPALTRSAYLQHAIEGHSGFHRYFFRDGDLVLLLTQRFEGIFQSNFIHVVTAHAAQAQHLALCIAGSDVIPHAAFGQEQITSGLHFFDIANHSRGATGKIRRRDNFGTAFRMRQDDDIGELPPDALDVLHREFLMHLAATAPADDGGLYFFRIVHLPVSVRGRPVDDEVHAQLAGDVPAQVLVG